MRRLKGYKLIPDREEAWALGAVAKVFLEKVFVAARSR
jgi:hypothetical protein